ncbi:DNA-binding IclR family transcriptional regulator [Streptosporangium becharense]|uniref:DNA-binding IclR family transcriptional regulator n=1 Tax=Streptosporangium becharense TaxID=1816182 RepID=A0A7W9IAT2_9ACTN|nr:IclR family transcriptional regulator [Streptosporangium becharense]MBB2914236.1 DNA-binding IclR family transcriptional regulator [Streptosporangium becharense]MBB5817263.1 DNA-binding IclR family transcriptional regulator [Streptosporangium becharense]
MARSSSGESVLTRAVRILEAFSPQEPVLTVSQISRRAALPLATAVRLVEELTRHGLLARDEQRRVRIGNRLWELAQRASPMRTLRETAMQFMGDLHGVVGHSAQLGILDGEEVLFIERLIAPGAVVTVTQIGGRLPLHASSAGLVLLAHAPADVRDRVLRGPLQTYTPHTITDQRALRTALAEVRRNGFAFCPGHIRPNATGISVPVRVAGRVVAALGLVVPNDEHAWSLVRSLQITGMALSRALDVRAGLL